MPIYEYKCNACGHEFEELCFVPDEKPKCPKCNNLNTQKKISVSVLQSGQGNVEAQKAACSSTSGFS